jgi:hypothetical protein
MDREEMIGGGIYEKSLQNSRGVLEKNNTFAVKEWGYCVSNLIFNV